MADDVSDISRSYRDEFSVSIWSPSPVVKRRELVLSDVDKAAMGISSAGILVDNSMKQKHHRPNLSRPRSKPQVDEQPALGDSHGMNLWQVDEIATVQEEESQSFEEEINDNGDITDDGDGILTSSVSEDILEDDIDSIATSSISC